MEKKEFMLRLPENLFKAMDKYKKTTGVSYTNMLYNAMFWWLYSRNLISWKKETIIIGKKEDNKLIKEAPPQGIMYCDSPACEDTRGMLNEL